ncbi:MAG: FtsQ-type POTRA domain-containing protein [Lachnospiraceae bacterium]
MKIQKKIKIRKVSKPKLICLSVLSAILIVLTGIIVIMETYKVETVIVEGNQHYSEEEIKNIVMDGRLGDNSIYLSWKYKSKSIENVPFVEKMDVTILSADTIEITVYEKALAGYVEYLGRYMYFDKDGIIVESSELKTNGIPQVTGLKFGYVVLYEKLPVEDDAIFKQILNVTQLLNKYELPTDKIYFDAAQDMTLYFGEARADIGGEEYLDEKIMKLKYILPELEGKKGTLKMDHYTDDMKNITFQLD